MARNDVFLNINALSPADAVVTGQQDMTAATVPELVLGDTPTFNFYFTDNTNVWPSWAGNASYTLTWALSDAVAGDFAPAATTGNATPITGGWSVILPLNSYDLVGLLNTKRVGQPYPVQNLWQQLRVTDPSGNEVTRAMFWTPVRYRAISDTQNTESASPTGGRFVTVNNVNTLTTPTAAQFYAANPVPTSALGTAANGELLIGNGTGFTKSTLTAGTGITVTNGSGSITIDASGAQETLTATVTNAEAVPITKGQVVYIFGATGNRPSVKLAYNTTDATSAKTFGVVSDTSIAPNGTGTVTCVGVVDGLNLGAYQDGDTVYLGATPGSITATKPYAPNHLVYVGIVERANAGNGELYVRVQNGYELDEIHDVQINNPRQAGQTLIYDATNALWKNARLTAGVGVSITNADSSITISADGGVNYQGTWNASTNTPTLTSSVGTKGFYYVVSVAGSTNLNGVTDWKVGDWAIFNGTAWEKVDTTDQVSSVFGRTGAVVGVSTDYSSVGITNTAIGASNPSTGAFTTLTASSTTDSSSKDTGAIVTEGGLGVEKSASIGGNLTVSGNAAIGTDVFKIDSTNTRILFGLAAALQGDTVEIAAKSNAGAISLFGRASNNQSVISFRQNGSPTQKAFVQGGDTGLELGAGSSIGLTINSSNNTTLAGNLTVSGTGTSTFSGQISSTSAATASGDLRLNHSAGGKVIRWASANYNVDLYQSGDNDILRTRVANFAISSDPTFVSNFTTIAAGNITTSGNLTVSGGTITGGTSGLSLASGGTNQNLSITPSGTGRVHIAKSAGQDSYIELAGNGNTAGTSSVVIGQSGADLGVLYNRKNAALSFGTNGTEVARFFANGNLFVGASPVDGGQKLQVNGDAAFAGDRVINRKDQNAVTRLQVRNDTSGTAGQAQISATVGDFTTYTAFGQLSAGFTSTGLYQANSGYFVGSNALYIFTASASSLVLGTNSTTALTLDASQNATFAGAITSSRPYQDITSGLSNIYVYSTDTAAQDKGGTIQLGGAYTGTTTTTFGGVRGSKESTTAGETGGQLEFFTRANGGAMTRRAYISSTGNATFAGSVTVQGTTMTLSGSTFGIDMGAKGSANNPFFDFNSSGNNNDFDVRLQAKGGGAGSALGTLTLHATTVATASNAGAFIIGDSGTGTPTSGTAVAIGGGKIFTGSDVTVGGAIAIGNTVNTVSPTSPNRTITMVIGGTTYYIHAKTTND